MIILLNLKKYALALLGGAAIFSVATPQLVTAHNAAVTPLGLRANLFLSIPQSSAVDNKRFYASYGTATSKTEFKGDFYLDGDFSSITGGMDFGLDQGRIASAGLNQWEKTWSYSETGYSRTSAVSEQILIGRFFLPTSDKLDLSIGARNVAREAKINEKIGSVSKSGTASLSYLDLGIGGRYKINEDSSFVFGFSPEVSASGNYGGDYTGWVNKSGHGREILLGGGYMKDNYSLGANYLMVEESFASFSSAGTELSFAGEVGFDDSAVGASITTLSYEKLVNNGRYYNEPITGTIMTVEGNIGIDEGRGLYLAYSTTSYTAGDFGDAVVDETRMESYNSTFLSAGFIMNL